MATTLTPPAATQPQVLNAQLASTLYTCWSRLQSIKGDYHPMVMNILAPTLAVSCLSGLSLTPFSLSIPSITTEPPLRV